VALELLRFLAGFLLLALPGVFLAAAMRLGRNALARCTYGAWLGLALAIVLGSAVSQINLNGFYPL